MGNHAFIKHGGFHGQSFSEMNPALLEHNNDFWDFIQALTVPEMSIVLIFVNVFLTVARIDRGTPQSSTEPPGFPWNPPVAVPKPSCQ